MKTTTLNVKGMHCNACKLLLEQSLSKLPRIKKVEAKVSKGTVSLSYEGTLPLEDITTVIRECGYEVSEEAVNRPRLSKNLKDYKILLISLISFILLYLILRQTGISSLFDIQSQKSPSLGLVLLIGITAGFSSCMAVVGGLVLAISTKRNTHNTQQSFGQKIIPHLRFNVGRIVGFGVLGGVLGLFGSVLNLSPFVMAVITLIVGVVMLVLGINLTHISPKISSFSFSLPKTPLTSLDPLVEKSHSSLKNSWKTFGAGMLTFFLPCGFTFAMQLYAISTGSFRMGMAVMSLFAVGTLPGLLGVWSLTSVFKGKVAQIAYKVIWVLVVLLGLYNISHSYGIVAGKLSSHTDSSSVPSSVPAVQQVETINMVYAKGGLKPAVLNLEVGKSYEIVIDVQTTIYGCMSTIFLRGLDENMQSIEEGKQITFRVVPSRTGTYEFLCAMGLPHNAKVLVK